MTRPARPRARRPGSRERGSAAAELVLVTPFLFLLLLFAVAAGRLVQARLDVNSAAQQAARAASLGPHPRRRQRPGAGGRAGGAGRAVRYVVIPPWSPRRLGDFTPGGEVTVTVSCTVHLSDLSLLHIPGSETITATFTAPIDV